MSYEDEGIIQMDAEELRELLVTGAKEPILIDVRELDEYAEAHIPGVPLIPMNTIASLSAELDRSASYVFICRSGKRSQNVALFLKEQGILNVRNFVGGMISWQGDIKSGLEWVVKDVNELKKD
ncbi:rhodanese-like domain-containing protein [Alkalicoccobacillus porphyridii]|uniref:Rhodanese-like domain-containing protein n=1 Tax=Alkalicoccobacillus porphyridii TaxID=2597270 RepID=A0A553ZXH5_9BACI|nr:rhodanese-like domain-containing protein [Alkalicoccobacillus porphyridii]TSB46161.1 rhodanese-like domain-containing protein [Alkalicoccobacillus porphyridii]